MTPQEQIAQLQSRIEQLETLISKHVRTDNFTFEYPLHGGPNGLRLLTNTKEKLAFFGVAPVAQYTTALNGTAGAAYGGTEQSMLNAHNALLISYGLGHA